MLRGRNVHIPQLNIGDVCFQDVPMMDRGRSLGIAAIPVRVCGVLKNHTYRVMYKDGSVCQRAAHIATLDKATEEIWRAEWATLAQVRSDSKKPIRTAVKMYYEDQ
mgnify:CR=1 FL=1